MSNSKINFYLKSISYFINRFIFNRKYLVGHSEKYNLKFKFNSPDSVGREIYKKGIYEDDVTTYLLNNLDLKKDDIVFDVGANIGWYSNFLAKHFKDIEIHSFEPDPENFKLLSSNLKLNNSQNVILNNCGIGEKVGVLKLFLYKNGNLGRHSMLDINNRPSIDVDITSFDEYINVKSIDVSKISFLKIDIEGFEYFAFLGGKEFLKHVPIMLAEFSPDYMREAGLEPEKLLILLRSYGFSPFIFNGLNLDSIDDKTLLSNNSSINLIWKKIG